MHVALTDVLTCPRCGAGHGLILLSNETRERRVLHGWLGCANCRERWEVREGFAELRSPHGGTPVPPAAQAGVAPEREQAVRIAALLGITEPHTLVLVAGPAAGHASALADLIDGLEVIALDASLAGARERSGVNRMATGERFPFHDGRLHGVWLSGDFATSALAEGIRVLAPLGRIVLETAPPDARARLETAGLRVLAQQNDTIVAVRTP